MSVAQHRAEPRAHAAVPGTLPRGRSSSGAAGLGSDAEEMGCLEPSSPAARPLQLAAPPADAPLSKPALLLCGPSRSSDGEHKDRPGAERLSVGWRGFCSVPKAPVGETAALVLTTDGRPARGTWKTQAGDSLGNKQALPCKRRF